MGSFKLQYALILRGIQWLALIPIIGIIANFVNLLRRDNDHIPTPVMAALIIPVLAAAYCTLSLIGLYTAHKDGDETLKIPHLPSFALDIIFFISFICTAGALTNPITHLPCMALGKNGDISSEVASMAANALKSNFWVWVGTSRTFCQEMQTIMILLWILALFFAFSALYEGAHWMKGRKNMQGYQKDVV